MASWWQVQWLKRGVESWNAWRRKHPKVRPDLSKADLSDANLAGADLSYTNLYAANLYAANLCGANLCGSMLNESRLRKADLRDANLRGANLASGIHYGFLGFNQYRALRSGANLSYDDLRGAHVSGAADLSYANLSGVNLSSVNLSGANLSEAICFHTIFFNIDLRLTKGLAHINHRGPSAIHLSSLQLPQDGSGLHFLRGVGLTDEEIDLWHSMAVQPVQYHSVFISYSSQDEILASRLHADLQAHGVRCWFAPEDLKVGSKIRDHIDQAIQMQDRSLLLLSEHSIASSWVEHEVEAVLEKEARQQREILFPVRIDEMVMYTSKGWAANLRRIRYIGDFTSWTDPHQYQIAFERLLRDLKQD